MRFSFLFLFLFSVSAWAQKPCDFSTNISDSTGTYKATREYLMHERNFAGKATYLFNSIAINNGVPLLSLQLIEKADSFVKVRCFDPNSKVYLQLENGKIVTLLHTQDETCGAAVREAGGVNSRVLSGYFMFRKDDVQALQSSPISIMRVKFASETQDYIIKTAFYAELDKKLYNPSTYLIDYFHCATEAR